MASWDAEAECWIAVCDALPLATEAPTLKTLHERIATIIPDIVMLNDHAGGDFRLIVPSSV